MNTGDFLECFEPLTLSEKVRLKRLARRMRQVDVASAARVAVVDVVAFEKDREVPDHTSQRILDALDMER